MRQVRFLAFCVAALALSACNDLTIHEEDRTELQGELSLELSADSEALTRSGDAGEPAELDLDQFWVEIYKKVTDGMDSGIRLYRKQYVEAKNDRILLNAGEYYLRAKLGDSLGVGFTKPFYMAEKAFTVRPQTVERVSATAALANVKVSVNFGDNFKEYYPDYYVRVRHSEQKIKSVLKFKKDETRSGYIHHGEIVLEVCADMKGDGSWKYYVLEEMDSDGDGRPEPLKYNPNDHITFNIDAGVIYGKDIIVNFILNDETIDQNKAVTVPEYVAPQDAPSVSRQGFDEDGECYVYENRDVEYNGGQSISYSAKAGISSCVLSIDSEYLQTQYNLPSEVELVGMDDETATLLEKAGIRSSLGQFMGIVDFTDAMNPLGLNSVYTDATTPCAVFSVKVTDVAGKSAETDATMLVWPELKGSIKINDYDIWATKVVNPVFTATKGYPENATLQISTDGKVWEPLSNAGTVSGSNATFAELSGLKPATSYWLRAMDGDYLASDPVKITTEAALQLGNPSFEEFRIMSFTFRYKKAIWFGGWTNVTRYWYEVYANDSNMTQWATNSSASLDYEVTPEYLYYKCYPTVTLQKDAPADGNYYLMVASVATTDYGSEVLNGDAVTGELFIGTADNSKERRGNHTSEGDAFTSRPSALTFMHKFSCYNNDPYSVEVQLWDSNKNVIGRGFKNDQKTSVEPEWQKAVIPIEYSVLNKKAAYIYVIFKSSATGSKSSRKFTGDSSLKLYNTHVEKSGSSYVSVSNDPIHAGSILWLDDVRLEY